MQPSLVQRTARHVAVMIAALAVVVAATGCGDDGSTNATASTGTMVVTTTSTSPLRLAPIDLSNAPSIAQDPAGAAAGIAQYWSGYQRPSGDVFDPIYQRGGIRYSEAEWAYAATHLAAATSNAQLAEFGLKAADWVADHPNVQKTAPSSFEDAAMAGVALDVKRLPPSALRDRVARRVSAWLAKYRPALLFDSKYHTNKSLVEAVAIIDMLRAGVKLPRAAFWRARAMAIIGSSMPRVARPYTTTTSLGATTVLSDPPKNPIAYHALTLGYLARAVQSLGTKAPLETRRLLVHMARGLVFLTAPDGDSAQWGRSQAQAWSGALGAYGLRVAERYGTARDRGRFEATARALLGRLQTAYHRGPYGLFYVPAFADGGGAKAYTEPRGVDEYANAVTYVALATKALAWQLDVPGAGRPRTAGALAAIDGAVKLNAGSNGETIVVRKPTLWFGIRPIGMLDGNHGYDLRYDFGLYAAETKDAHGAWVDLIRPRPQTTGRGVDSAGPVLVTAGGLRGYPTTETATTDPKTGRVTLSVAWVHGTTTLGRGNVVYVPLSGGVRMAVLAPAGTHMEVSIFARNPRLTAAGVRDGQTLAQLSRGAHARVDAKRYGSAYDRVQRRVRVTFPVGAPTTVTYRLAP
jgi:hypothetical protein